jgi:hypothetical protein
MNTTEEKEKEVAEGVAEEIEAESAAPSDETGKDNHAGGPIILFFIVGLAVSLVIGWIVFPKLLYSQKKQPFDFNHKLHMGMDDIEDCESCHFFREDGTYAGVPKLAQCTDCHDDILSVEDENPKGYEEEKKFINEYVLKEKEVPWLVYAKQPDCVFFSHVVHVKTAGMDCVVCHGNIGESDSLKVYEENRITGYSRDIWGKNMLGLKKHSWDRMKMDDCAECHQKQTSVQTGKDACFVCHK